MQSPESQSPTLTSRFLREARDGGGWMSFARFMDIALYTPDVGYYAGGLRKFGAGGDFVTAPELTPLFGQAVATQIAQLLARSAPVVVEAGGGSGRLACDLMRALDQTGEAPEEYALLEVSSDLAARQKDLITQVLPDRLARRFRWLSAIPERISGVIVGNELLDAMPVHLLRWTDGLVLERGLATADGLSFSWVERPATGRVLEAAQAIARDHPLPDGYLSELSLAGPSWVRSFGERLDRGAIVLIDYGFPQSEYYHPQRDGGTVMCHHRHRAHTDPLLHIGQQDITAHVDFTAIADAGHEAGLAIAGYTSQAAFLMNCGILDLLAQLPDNDIAAFRSKGAVQKLLSPAEMGELFKVIVMTKGLADASPSGAPSGGLTLRGFASGDRRWRL